MKHPKHKSGQAMIFLMVVLVIGLFALIWNFDLHRVISAKITVRNAGDAAALAGARWQGYTLNMIGELNLMQAALLSEYIDPFDPLESTVPDDVPQLHELRKRLAFVGPLSAYAIAQQAAFNNGAFTDDDLADDLESIADDILELSTDHEPYEEAYQEYADLLKVQVETGVALGSYSLDLGSHQLEQKRLYTAIAQALGGWWCLFYGREDLLSSYSDYTSWGPLNSDYTGEADFFNLKLSSFTNVVLDAYDQPVYYKPGSALQSTNDYLNELVEYLEDDELIDNHGDENNIGAIYGMTNVAWHIYGYNWNRRWPSATYIDETTGEQAGAFPIRSDVRIEYNYMGAEAGVALESDVEKGIISRRDTDTFDLEYKCKAKPFGYLEVDSSMQEFPDGRVPPHYFGFVLPAFHEVRLIHSDIGDDIMEPAFYRHVKYHMENYLADGPDACVAGCRYCDLLIAWDDLDKQEGLEWLEEASSQGNTPANPCYVPPGGGGGSTPGGGTSGGT